MGTEQCEHPPSRLTRVDDSGSVQKGGELYLWAECECGAPTILRTTIEDIEVDTEGTAEHLAEFAEEQP